MPKPDVIDAQILQNCMSGPQAHFTARAASNSTPRLAHSPAPRLAGGRPGFDENNHPFVELWPERHANYCRKRQHTKAFESCRTRSTSPGGCAAEKFCRIAALGSAEREIDTMPKTLHRAVAANVLCAGSSMRCGECRIDHRDSRWLAILSDPEVTVEWKALSVFQLFT